MLRNLSLQSKTKCFANIVKKIYKQGFITLFVPFLFFPIINIPLATPTPSSTTLATPTPSSTPATFTLNSEFISLSFLISITGSGIIIFLAAGFLSEILGESFYIVRISTKDWLGLIPWAIVAIAKDATIVIFSIIMLLFAAAIAVILRAVGLDANKAFIIFTSLYISLISVKVLKRLVKVLKRLVVFIKNKFSRRGRESEKENEKESGKESEKEGEKESEKESGKENEEESEKESEKKDRKDFEIALTFVYIMLLALLFLMLSFIELSEAITSYIINVFIVFYHRLSIILFFLQ